jgi:transposase-like protein
MSDEIEKKMLSLFSLGNSYSQIIDYIEEIYGVGFSKPAITAVTDKLIPMLEEWKKRPLDTIYPFVYLDAIHYKVREDGHYICRERSEEMPLGYKSFLYSFGCNRRR